MGRLRLRSVRGRLQAKPKRLFFSVILVTHPKSYIETTGRRDFGGKRQSGGEDGCYGEKFRNFIARAEPNPKNSILGFLWCHSTICKQFYSKPMTPMESRDSDGVPFASLESL